MKRREHRWDEPYAGRSASLSLFKTWRGTSRGDGDIEFVDELPQHDHGEDCICRTPEWDEGLIDPWGR